MTESRSARLSKDWNAPVYAFYQPVPEIGYEDGRRYHSFRCAARSCKQRIRRYLDKKDGKSTRNLRKHAKSCWVPRLWKPQVMSKQQPKHASTS